MTLKYLIGDVTEPIEKPVLICHICNDCQPGCWGAGFTGVLSKKNKSPEKAYRKWSLEGSAGGYELGAIQLIPFAKQIMVANMLAQHDTRWKGKIPPIRYNALEQCLNNVYKHAKEHSWVVAGPRFGADLAGGSWERIEAIIKKTMTVDTYIYTLESQKDRWPTQYENIVPKSPVMTRTANSVTSFKVNVDLKNMKISPEISDPKKYIVDGDEPATSIPSVLDAGDDPNDFVITDDNQQVNGTDLNDLFR